jgi:superfamily II DNA/RNA helicase
MEFQELNLHPDLQKGIDEAGFTTCMPVQEMVFAHSLLGQDIYAQSQTGTGKTAAFLISIMQRIMTKPELRARRSSSSRRRASWPRRLKPKPRSWASTSRSARAPSTAA